MKPVGRLWKNLIFRTVLLLFGGMVLTGCIYEYPVPEGSKGDGRNPETVTTYLEIICEVSWERLLHKVDFSTKALPLGSHRVVIEVRDEALGTINSGDGKVVRDIVYLDDEEFAKGKIRHRLSLPLNKARYEVAVWYDKSDEDGEYYFEASDLNGIRFLKHTTFNHELYTCAYGSSTLDLTNSETENSDGSVVKEITLEHPGARFEIVATDVQEFITQQKAALMQDDRFTANMNFRGDRNSGFNVFEGRPSTGNSQLKLSGWMRLPYDEYDELVIAQGFLFCGEGEETAEAELSVTNTALMTVSRTDFFTFPIKRGQITVVSGDFLTHPVDGVFEINSIWAGEMYFEYGNE